MHAYIVITDNARIENLYVKGNTGPNARYVSEEIPLDAQSSYFEMKLNDLKAKINP